MIADLITTLAATDPVSHVIDHKIGDSWLISNASVMLVVAFFVTLIIVLPAAKKIATSGEGRTADDFRAQGAQANFVEAVCLYLREDVFRPVLGKDTDTFMPILWTFFWYILVCNFLGLVPILDITGLFMGGHGIGGTATQSIWVTGGLAFIAFLLINIVGIARDPKGYFKHMTGGAPIALWPIIIPVEAAGIIVKPAALALRLFANMTGGHILLAVLFGLAAKLFMAGGINFGIGLIPLFGAVAIYLLECLVALIQAFIFTFLTGLFLGQLIAHHGDEHH